MSDFPVFGNAVYLEGGGKDASNSDGTTVTPGSNVYGAWVELIASTTENAGILMLRALPLAGDNSRVIDIGIGAASSEEVICPELLVDHSSSNAVLSSVFLIPVNIPAGSRVAVRTKSAGARTSSVTIDLFSPSFKTPGSGSRLEAIGISGHGGTAVDAGASANTKGAWAELSASISNDAQSIILVIGNNSNGTMANASFLVDVGIGGSGSEVVILSDFYYETSGSEGGACPLSLPISIPAGSRVAVRSQSTSTDATDRVLAAAIYGVS